MTDDRRELTTLRRRQAELAERLDRTPGDTLVQGPALLVKVFAETTVPTATLKYFACHPVKVGGAETEGTAPTLAADTAQKLYVAVLGGPVPVAGDYLIARLVGGRWVARAGGPAPPCAGPLCVKVTGCNAKPVPWAVVTVTNGGSFSASGTVTTFASTVTVVTKGSGFTNTATAAIAGTGGSGATATAYVHGGAVVAIVLGAPGSGFTGPSTGGATVTFSGGGGTGATATATLATTTVASFAVTAAGASFTSTPAVFVDPPPSGTAATGRALLTGTTLDAGSATVTNGGSGYTSAPTVSFTNPTGQGGSGAVATATVVGGIVTAITITNAGTGYTAPPTISFSGGGGSGATATVLLTATTLASITRVTAGSGYTSAPTVTVTGGGGTGATATAALTGRGVSALTLTGGGSGYTSPTVTLTGGSGTGTTFGVNVSGGQVQTIVVVAAGSGYVEQPTLAITGGGGTGATATAVLISQFCCNPASSDAGPFSASVVASRFTTGTASGIAYSCANGTTTTVALSVAAGYACCVLCWKPIATTLYATDNNGTHTLTWNAVQSQWISSTFTATVAGVGTRTGGGVLSCSTSSTAGVDAAVSVSCNATNGFRYGQSFTSIQCCVLIAGDNRVLLAPTGTTGSETGAQNEQHGFFQILQCPDPFSLTFSIPGSDVSSGICGTVALPSNGTVTVTE